MDEASARDVVLLRALETADTDARLVTADDRRYASRAAGELAHWHAADARVAATPELYLAQRARLALDKLAASLPAVRALRGVRWRPWIGIALPLVALALGAVVEQVADRRHVNVLAFPLLGVIAWNLAVYVGLLVKPILGRSLGRSLGPLRRWIAGVRRAPDVMGDATTAAAAARFAGEWSELSAPLLNARAGRVLHMAAALFAVGALAGLYLRALAFEYRIGWESTFLQAPAVHSILSFVLGPAAKLLGMPFPSVEAIEAMRITTGAAGQLTGGANAGPWIHLYAVTLALVVIVPRLLLAAWCAWRERRLSGAFRLDLSAPYFRRLLASFAPGSARVRVLPYSYTLDEGAVAGLNALARHLLGEATQLALRPSTDFGAEAAAAAGLPRREADVPLTLAVFNAAAIPENENHGLFVDTLRGALDTPLALLVDTGPYRARLGTDAAASQRLAERLDAWRSFAAQRRLPVSFVDLGAPDATQAERDLAPALEAAA